MRAAFSDCHISACINWSRNVSHAGTIQRRNTLFGEIGLPDHVANINDSGSVCFTRARQSTVSVTAASDNGICRRVLGIYRWHSDSGRIRSPRRGAVSGDSSTPTARNGVGAVQRA